jgi:hypothetical protein
MPHVLQRASWAVPLPKGWGLYSTPNHKPHARGSGGTPSRHHPCAAAVTDGNAPMNATWHDHHPPPSGLQHQQRADTHHEGIVCVAASTESQSATGHRRGALMLRLQSWYAWPRPSSSGSSSRWSQLDGRRQESIIRGPEGRPSALPSTTPGYQVKLM